VRHTIAPEGTHNALSESEEERRRGEERGDAGGTPRGCERGARGQGFRRAGPAW